MSKIGFKSLASRIGAVCVFVLILTAGQASAQVHVSVQQEWSDTIRRPVPIKIFVTVDNQEYISAFNMGFRFWWSEEIDVTWLSQPDGYGPLGQGTGVSCVTVPPPEYSPNNPPDDIWDATGFLVDEVDLNQLSPDIIMLHGAADTGGLPALSSYLFAAFNLELNWPEGPQVYTLCIDTVNIPPDGDFVFADINGENIIPTVGLPECWPVKWSNLYPEITNCPGMTIHHDHCNGEYSYYFSAYGEEWNFYWDIDYFSGTGTIEIDETFGNLTYVPSPDDVGDTVTIGVRVRDYWYCYNECQFEIYVTNSIPELLFNSDLYHVYRGDTFVYDDIIFSDDDPCDQLVSTIIDGPGYIDSVTGPYTWPTTVGDVGVWDLTLELGDGYYKDTCNLQIDVMADYICGDVNADGNINISDVSFLIRYIFQNGNPPAPLAAADCNMDGNANIADVAYLINYIFSGGPSPCE